MDKRGVPSVVYLFSGMDGGVPAAAVCFGQSLGIQKKEEAEECLLFSCLISKKQRKEQDMVEEK